MGAQWKPGDLATGVVTTRGRGRRNLRRTSSSAYPWHVEDDLGGSVQESAVEDIRPGSLVQIDPEDREQVERLVRVMADLDGRPAGALLTKASDQMQTALREYASPTPPKPEEPTGLGAVVEDAEGFVWVRTADNRCGSPWSRRNIPGTPRNEPWSEITAVRVLSEGVTP